MILNCFKKKKIRNLDASLRNLLSYLLANMEKLSGDLSCDYTLEERREFVYNCAINTIYEFIQEEKTHIVPIVSSGRMMHLFKINYMLQQFHKPEINPYMDKTTIEIIKKFEALKIPLRSQDKNDLMSDVNKLLTSAM